MSGSSVVAAIERFFGDIVGTAVPGAALILGWDIVFGGVAKIAGTSIVPPQSVEAWLFFAGAAYVLGHVLTSIGERLLVPTLDQIVSVLAPHRESRSLLRKLAASLVGHFFISDRDLFQGITHSFAYAALRRSYKARLGEHNDEEALHTDRVVRHWRSIALSVVQDREHIVQRFMFLSLLNLGLAVVVLILVLGAYLLWVFSELGLRTPLYEPNDQALVLMLLVLPFLLERRYRFYGTSMRLPFSMAAARLGIQAGQATQERGKDAQ